MKLRRTFTNAQVPATWAGPRGRALRTGARHPSRSTDRDGAIGSAVPTSPNAAVFLAGHGSKGSGGAVSHAVAPNIPTHKKQEAKATRFMPVEFRSKVRNRAPYIGSFQKLKPYAGALEREGWGFFNILESGFHFQIGANFSNDRH